MSSSKFMFFGPMKKRWQPRPLIGWDSFDFSSETDERNSTTLDRKEDFNLLRKFVFFGLNEKKKQDWRLGLKLSETFWTPPIKPLKGIQRNLTGIKIWTSSTEFVFRADWTKETGWPTWPLIGWDISTSHLKPLNGIQRNLTGCTISTCSTKFVFSGRSEKQDDSLRLWLAETFLTSPLEPLKGIQRNLAGSKISMSSSKFMLFEPMKKRWQPRPLIG